MNKKQSTWLALSLALFGPAFCPIQSARAGFDLQSTADTKGDSVVERLLEAVVVEQNTRGSVNVGVGVLGL